MRQRAATWMAIGAGMLVAALGAGCGDDAGFEDCVANCERMTQCTGSAMASSTCEDSCDDQQQSADDRGCDDEFADYQACVAGLEGCEFSACNDASGQLSACYVDFCRDNPDDPECQLDSAPSSSGSGGSGSGG